MKSFKIITDSCCDLPLEIIKDLNIKYMGIVCNFKGMEYIEDGGRTLSYKDFFTAVRNGEMPSTSQINSFVFYKEFERYVKSGEAILYIAFSSNMSGTYNNALIAKEEILKKYPDADISIVDSKAASSGLGLLVYRAAKMKNEGKSKEEIVEWLEGNKLRICHFFIVSDLEHLKNGGRISATSAKIGSILDIKPVLYVDDNGKLKIFDKARGMRKAIRILYNSFTSCLANDSFEDIFISHADNIDGANNLLNIICENNRPKNVLVTSMGLAIGSHTGADTICLFFIGDQRKPR